MKKLTIAALIASLTLSPITVQAKEAPDLSHYYPQTFVIYEVDREEDILYVMTADREYDFELTGVEDWHAGDIASAIMYDNGTKDIRDDVIVDLQYDGSVYDF